MKNHIQIWRAAMIWAGIFAGSLCQAQEATLPPKEDPLPKSATFAQVEARWSKVSSNELRAAAAAGVADAQFYFGKIEIDAAREDNGRSMKWSTLAATPARIVFTEKQTAEFREKWKGVAEPELRAAATAGDQAAQFCMAKWESDQAFVRGRQGLDWVKRAAQQSFVRAEEMLANYYLREMGWILVPPDEKEGMKWLESAASHGSEMAQHKFADFLLTGRHGSPDVPKGLEWLRKAVDLKCPRAAYELGMYYANGNGEPRDASETPVELFRRAGVAGHNLGMAALAERYRIGFGVERDYVRAIRIYQSALQADRGADYDKRSNAENILNVLDEKDEPRQRTDPFAQVYSLYSKAVREREPDSMNEIGQLYLRAANVPKNPVEAYKWLSLAAARGHTDAIKARDQLKATLSTADLEKTNEKLPEFKQLR